MSGQKRPEKITLVYKRTASHTETGGTAEAKRPKGRTTIEC